MGQYEHWALVASVLEHKDNVLPCSNLSIIDPVFPFVLVSLLDTSLLQQDVIVAIPPLCIKCITTKSWGRELSCAFDAILQFVEIKSVEKA